MKKILSLLFILNLIVISGISLKAAPQQFVEFEEVSLLDKNYVSFNNVNFSLSNYQSTGYVALNMGYGTTYTVNLNNIFAHLEHYNVNNVANIELKFELEALYTGFTPEQYQWLSSSTSSWNINQTTLSLGNTMPFSASTTLWWNVIGQSGGAPSTAPGGLRLRSITLVVHYGQAVQVYQPIFDWDNLAMGALPTNSFTNIEDLVIEASHDVQLVKNLNGTYNVFLDIDGEKIVYNQVLFPAVVGEKEIKLAKYLVTSDSKFLWLFFDINEVNLYDSDFLLWNLTNGSFIEVDTKTIYGMPYATGDGVTTYNKLYVDFVIPYEVDRIISMKVEYWYRHRYLFNHGQWNKVVEKTVYESNYSSVEHPWWNPIGALITHDLFKVYEPVKQIEDITAKYSYADKVRFKDYLNSNKDLSLQVTDIFTQDATIAKVFLGQHSKFGSVGLEAKDIVLLEFKFITNGVEYFVSNPTQIISDTPTEDPIFPIGDPLNNLLDSVWGFISKVWVIALAVASILIAPYIAKILPKKYKNSFLTRMIIASVLFLILYLQS